MTRLRVGVSACFFHADPQRAVFKGKTLLYAEESMLAWLMEGAAVPVLLPRARAPLTAGELLDGVDALVLQGGSDMAPGSYGEAPARPEWAGDAPRDAYEIELVRLALARRLPVLGVCRGAQVLNVALGGTLWQDIATMHPERRVHRDWAVYDQLEHEIAIEPGSLLARWYGGATGGRVNSVHHQGLRELGQGLVVEARSVPDGVIEAVRLEGEAFAYGVQWHPEFSRPDQGHLDPRRLAAAFLEETARRRRSA